MKKTKHLPIATKLSNFLLKYRLTPTIATGKSPSNLMFNFKPKSLFDVLNDKSGCVKNFGAVINSKGSSDDKIIKFEIGEIVSYQKVWNNFVKFPA